MYASHSNGNTGVRIRGYRDVVYMRFWLRECSKLVLALEGGFLAVVALGLFGAVHATDHLCLQINEEIASS